MFHRLRVLLVLCVVVLSGCTSIERLAIPEAGLVDARFETSGRGADPDHGPWSDFLTRYARVDEAGVRRVAYGEVDADARASLTAYLERLQAVDPGTLGRAAQLAYWVNLYNAATVDVILDHYPVHSIRAIRDSPLDPGPWENPRLAVSGELLSLHDIEHGILRPLWPDTPQIHYLLNCAAAGCPNLGATAYTSANVEAALDAAAQAYVNDPRGVTLLPNGRLQVSKIYAWYQEDFGGTRDAVLAHLRRYAEPDLRTELEARDRIDRHAYDWSLNDAAASPGQPGDE